MYADRETLPADSVLDEFTVTCSEDTCPMRTPYGPWTYHITRVRSDYPNHATARHDAAEAAWEAHVAEHHPGKTAQHRARPKETTP